MSEREGGEREREAEEAEEARCLSVHFFSIGWLVRITYK